MTLHLTKTRTYLELRVGSNAAVEVILYLRQADLAWFNNNIKDKDDNNNEDHTTDLFQVLEQSVLPRMMPQEIEDLHYKHNRETKQPPPLGPSGIPILVADGSDTNKNNKGKKQDNAKKGGGTKRKRMTAKEKAAAAFQEEQSKQENKRQKDVYYAFGKTLQLAYKWEDIASTTKGSNNSALLVFRNDDTAKNGNNQNQGILCQLDKLPKRIVAWVFPFDPSKPTEPDPTDGGFPLPERIPIAHLFRGGGGNADDDDDDDDDAQAKAWHFGSSTRTMKKWV